MIALSATDVRVCEACWNAPVTAARHTPTGRDLLCEECTEGDYPRRVDLFPPFGVYGLTTRKVLNDGRHGSGPRSPRPTRALRCPTRPRTATAGDAAGVALGPSVGPHPLRKVRADRRGDRVTDAPDFTKWRQSPRGDPQ